MSQPLSNLPPGVLPRDLDDPEPCPQCDGEGCPECAHTGLAETTLPKRGFSYSRHYRDPFQGRKSL